MQSHCAYWSKRRCSRGKTYQHSLNMNLNSDYINRLIIIMIKSQIQFPLQYKYKKILHCVPALDSTFVILAIKYKAVECIAHLNKNGKVIAQKQYKNCNLNQMAVLTQKQVIFLNYHEKSIVHWDLQTHEFMDIPYDYHTLSVSQQIIVFPSTSMFCVCQYGDQNSNFFKLTYFSYPITTINVESIYIYESETIWNYDYTISRGNTSSMIIWYKDCQKQKIELKTFDLTQKKFKHYQIQNTKQPKLQFHIHNIWESNRNQFTICAIVDKQKIKIQADNKEIYPHSVFICNVVDKTFRQSKFKFEGKYEVQIVQVIPFGQIVMFRTFDFNNQQVRQSPVYYVHNQSEEILIQDSWKCSYLSKYQLVGYDGNMLIETQYQNGNVQYIKCIFIKFLNIRETLAMFLHHIIGDNCDEALVQSVVELIKPQ